jgi:predicted Zn-dependent peptidase
MSSRLFQEIREKRGLAYSVFSYSSLFNESGAFVIYAGTNKKNLQKVVDLILEQIYSLADKEPQSEELEKAKNQIKSQLVLSLESTSARMMRLGRSVMAEQKILTIDEVIKKIDEVTAEKIKNLAQKLFKPSRIVLTAIGPLKESEVKIW